MARPRGHPDNALIASLASDVSWAKTEDRSARTRKAREAFNARFLAEADGDPVRAEHLRRAYYKRLALRGIQARRRKRSDGGDRDAA